MNARGLPRLARRAGVLATVAAAPLACGPGEGDRPPEARAPVLEYDTLGIRVASPSDTIPLTVEVAETDVQRSYGLMQRDSLGEAAGMLFAYEGDHAPTDGFWMWRTRIPLDIAFLDAGGEIVAIRTMQPCDRPTPNECPSYAPGVPWRDALEVRGGWFERHGIAVGDRVLVPPEPAGDGTDASSQAPSGDERAPRAPPE